MKTLYTILLISFSFCSFAETIYLKDMMREEPKVDTDTIKENTSDTAINTKLSVQKIDFNENIGRIKQINSFFIQIKEEAKSKGIDYEFIYLDKQILMSKINYNIIQINPQITQFRAFTLFKMEKMLTIFNEINIYLEEKYGKEK